MMQLHTDFLFLDSRPCVLYPQVVCSIETLATLPCAGNGAHRPPCMNYLLGTHLPGFHLDQMRSTFPVQL